MWDTNADGATMTAAEHHATASELTLYAHPFSSYCQKVLVALYENATPFNLRMMEFGD